MPTPSHAHIASLAAALLAALCLAAGTAAAAEAPLDAATRFSEYEVKAAFLFNFAKFVAWPDDRLGDTEEPIVIGVLGEDAAMLRELERVVDRRRIEGRSVVVRHVDPAAGTALPHILYVCRQQDAAWRGLQPTLDARGVLTVGESVDFTRSGGIVTFAVERGRLGFEINAGAAGRADLRISAQLQKLAQSVRR